MIQHTKEHPYLNITYMFLLLIFALFVVYYFPLSYSQVNITSSQTLSNTPGNSTDPKIGLYNNNVYVVWSDDSTGNGDIYFKRSVDNGTTFGSLENLSNTPGNSTDPKIALDHNNVYVVWSDDSTGNGDIYFKRSVDNGTTFASLENLSNTPGNSTDPKIGLHNNNVYVVWSDDSTGNGDIYFKRSVDNGTTFGSLENLSNTPGNSTDPKIALDNNNVYVVWSDDSTGNGDIYFKRSVDNGTTFDSTNNISKNNTGTSSTPQVAANSGNVYVIWTDTTSGASEINYRQSVDGGAKFAGIRELSKTRSIDGESARFPQIVTAGNNVYVAWQDSVQGGNEIFFRASTDLGTKFTGIKNLSRNNTGDSISPRIAAIAGNVFVGWSDASPGKSEILLRSSVDSGDTFRGIKNVSWSIGNSYDPHLAISRNNLYALWEDDSQEGLTFDLTFRGSSDGGRSFSDKQDLARYIGESSDYGQLIATENNVYVVWSENPQYSYPAKYEIFIKASRDNGTNFGDGVNLSNSEGNSIKPHIAVSEDQRNVFVVWSDNISGNSEISLAGLRI